jgi:hypothetical protein
VDININKIRVKEDYVEVEFNNKTADKQTTKDTKFKSYLKPHPDFITAMTCLNVDVIEILELPTDYINGLDVKSVSINHEADGIGSVISAIKKLNNSDAPFCLNTPYQAPQRNEYQNNAIGLKLTEKIEKLMLEVYKYMFENKTAQMELEFGRTANE